MNARAALYGSLHMISIASHAVTKVLDPVHLRLVLPPSHRVDLPTNKVAVKLERPSPIFSFPNSL